MKTQTAYTTEEKLYRKLLFAYLHYETGKFDMSKALDKCEELLKEVMISKSLRVEFKKEFFALWRDQVSKLHDAYYNMHKALRHQFDVSVVKYITLLK